MADVNIGSAPNSGDGDPLRSAFTKLNQSVNATTAQLADKATRTEGRLLRNRGAVYPMKVMVRDGVTSAAQPAWLDGILDARVVGAKPGKYYQVSYFQNGAAISGVAGTGWIIREFDAATYAIASGQGVYLWFRNDAGQPVIDPAAGIQTIEFKPRPEFDGDTRVILTIDPAGLPAPGVPVDSNSNNTRIGWSWIIDPACYEYRALFSPLDLARGNDYPNRRMVRNSVSSPANAFLRDAVLDVKVIGARPGHYYGLRYFKNGTTALGGPPDAWIIDEQPMDTYGSTADAVRVINRTDPTPDLLRGGIQTHRLKSVIRPGLEVLVTLDTDKLPAYGTFISMLNDGDPGRSWIIDPLNYQFEATPFAPSSEGALGWSVGTDGALQAVWRSANQLMRLRFGPNGRNSLPNVIGVDTSPADGTPNWTQINGSATDWLPPLTVAAVSGGDGSTPSIYTGGNHGTDGSGGGEITARCVHYALLVDGQPLKAGVAQSGGAKIVTALIVNEIMGFNTCGRTAGSTPRHIIRQSLIVDFHPGGMEVRCDVHALEAVTVNTDNGLQMLSAGYQSGDMLYAGGQFSDPFAFDPTVNSGPKSTYPEAWATILNGTFGQQVSWMDREFDAGDGRYVGAAQPMMRCGGATNTKMYHAVVAGNPASLGSGESYRWRGGYAWQAANLEGDTMAAQFIYWLDGIQRAALVFDASDQVLLP